MTPLEWFLAALALTAATAGASVATVNFEGAVQDFLAEQAEQAEQSGAVYTFGDTITIDGVEIVIPAAD